MGRLTNQVALVTGGSRGIGRAICRTLDAEGARVIVHYHRRREEAVETRGRLQPSSPAIVQADLASLESVTQMVAGLADESVDILVNNGGIWKGTPMGAASEVLLDEVLNTNLRGVFWLTQAMLP